MTCIATPDGGYADVHPAALIEGDVKLSNGVRVGPFSYLVGDIRIGPGTRIGAHVVIGTDGEHRSVNANVGQISIGAGVIIREFSCIQRGTGDRDTTIGDGCMLMDHSHVAHDVVLCPAVTLSPNVVLGGHTRVHRGATIGIGAMTHQFSTVGAYSMVGMGSVVTKDIPPFALVMGSPARYVRENVKGKESFLLSPRGDEAFLWAMFNADSRRVKMSCVSR